MDNFNCPISQTRLRQISNDACDSALATATAYNHAQTASWNDTIINSVLKALVSESQTAAAPGSSETRYKFCVNSTIIQHLSDPRPSGTTSTASAGTSTATDTEKTAGDAAVEGEAEEELKKEVGGGGGGGESEEAASSSSSNKAAPSGPGRRGMHSASGAYWNNAKDGMWSHKYEGGEAKGMDIVIAIMWIAA